MMDKRIPGNDSQYSSIGQTYSLKLLSAFEGMLDELSGCFAQERTLVRAKTLASAFLCSEPPHTITNWLMAAGLEDVDWTGSYDFFSKARWNASDVLGVVLEQVAGFCDGNSFYAALDEMHLPKSGRKIPSVSTLRDPLGLHFTNPLHRAQRWLNVSCLLPTSGSIRGPVRSVPVDFRLTPPARKPGKKASDEQRRLYEQEAREKSISLQGIRAVRDLREALDKVHSWKHILLVMAVDGGFTNGTVFGDIPERTIIVGRTGKNIALCAPAPPYSGKGRRRKYGERLGNPEQVRQDEKIPWQKAKVWACGKWHELEYKTIAPVLWQGGTKDKRLRLIVIRPLSYRLSKKSKLLYREPAYLLVSDPDYPVELALQCYFHRWEIEVNHRDMKSIMGVGDAQVRNPESASRVPAFATAVYSLMLLSSLKAYGPSRDEHYGPVAKWRNDVRPRPSTTDILRRYRWELQQAGVKSFRPLASQVMGQHVAKNSLSPQAICHGNGDGG